MADRAKTAGPGGWIGNNAAVAQSVQQDVLNVINAPTQALFDR